jgi:hypothetical protein
MKREVVAAVFVVSLVLLGSVFVVASSHSNNVLDGTTAAGTQESDDTTVAGAQESDDSDVAATDSAVTDSVTDKATDKAMVKDKFRARVRDSVSDVVRADRIRERDEVINKYRDRLRCTDLPTDSEVRRCVWAKRWHDGTDVDRPTDFYPNACKRLANANVDFTRRDCADLEKDYVQCDRLYDDARLVKKCYLRHIQAKASDIKEEIRDTRVTDKVRHDHLWRRYLFALMGNLINRVENAMEHGDVGLEAGEEFIAQAEVVQRLVVSGGTKSEVKEEITVLREIWSKYFV